MPEALRVIILDPENGVDFDEKDIPSGFETVGDVAHLNLNEKQFPFRYQVGQVVLDKNVNLRSVVCKIG